MKRALALSAIGVLAFAAPAHAETLTPVWNESWQGPYFGVNIGYGWGNARTSGAAGSARSIYNGVIGGGQVGYNFQFNRFVFGAETDIQASSLSGTSAFGGTAFRNRLNWFGTARLRAGYDLGRFLPYITGGLAYGDNRLTATTAGAAANATRTHLGWAAGGGLEYDMIYNISVRAEYLYTDLRRKTYGGTGVSVRPNFHAVRFGVNLRF